MACTVPLLRQRQPLCARMNGGIHVDFADCSDRSGAAPDRRAANVGLQLGLGLLAERRSWAGRADLDRAHADGQDLGPCTAAGRPSGRPAVFLEFASGALVKRTSITRRETSMRTAASIAGHPIHVMLVSLPIGLWVFSLICDVILMTGHNPDLWFTVAYVTMAGGIVGALLAAVFGLIDLVSLPRGHTRNLGLAHMAINLVIVAVFAFDLYLRTGDLESMTLPFVLSIVGIAMLSVSGWLG